MSNKRKIYLLGMFILLINSSNVYADWTVADDFTQSPSELVNLDNDKCMFRLRFIDNEHAATGVYQDIFFPVTKVHQFRNDSGNGPVYSQSFSTPIDRSSVGNLYFGGALTYSQWQAISDLSSTGNNIWDLSLSVIRNSTIHQLSLSYRWFNEAYGTVYSTSNNILDRSNFRLEQNCSDRKKNSNRPGK